MKTTKVRYLFSAVILTVVMSIVPARAESSTAEQVKTWTVRQWNQTAAEFRKDKAKWASCRRQSSDMKLKGKASWSFLYGCMKA